MVLGSTNPEMGSRAPTLILMAGNRDPYATSQEATNNLSLPAIKGFQGISQLFNLSDFKW